MKIPHKRKFLLAFQIILAIRAIHCIFTGNAEEALIHVLLIIISLVIPIPL